jgi:hypothetical protein
MKHQQSYSLSELLGGMNYIHGNFSIEFDLINIIIFEKDNKKYILNEIKHNILTNSQNDSELIKLTKKLKLIKKYKNTRRYFSELKYDTNVKFLPFYNKKIKNNFNQYSIMFYECKHLLQKQLRMIYICKELVNNTINFERLKDKHCIKSINDGIGDREEKTFINFELFGNDTNKIKERLNKVLTFSENTLNHYNENLLDIINRPDFTYKNLSKQINKINYTKNKNFKHIYIIYTNPNILDGVVKDSDGIIYIPQNYIFCENFNGNKFVYFNKTIHKISSHFNTTIALYDELYDFLVKKLNFKKNTFEFIYKNK